jgi:hypothetical protein
MVSGSISLPVRGAFHLSLTVLSAIGRHGYLALEGGPPGFTRDSTCPVLLEVNSNSKLPFSPTRLSLSMVHLSRCFG